MLVLRNGKEVEIGSTVDMIERPTQAYTRELLSVHKTAHGPAASAAAPRPLLTLDKVSARYGSHLALDQVSLALERSKTLAIVGESGSGKSTLGRVIAGLKPVEGGSLQLDGRPLPSGLGGRGRELLRRIQIIYQMPDVALNPRHRIGEILARPVRFYFGLPAREVRARVDELLRLIDLPPDFKSRLPGEMSGGQKQRVCIARALAAEPDIVICDEVTSALDPLVAQDILTLLERLQREAGIAYLFITHDLGVVRRIAHHVLVLRHGKVVETGPLPQAYAPPRDPYTELLLRCVPQMRTDWLDDVLRSRSAPAPTPTTLAR
jgi:peptide/nickel transport system ATP-binding protein